LKHHLNPEQKIIAMAQIFVKVDRNENFGEKMRFSPELQKLSEEGLNDI